MSLKRFISIMILCGSLPLSLSAGGYVCETDPAYEAYASGETGSLVGATLYADARVCRNNCLEHYRCVAASVDGKAGYTCPMYGSMDIGGDLAGNLFSSESACETKCVRQNNCVLWEDNGCRIVASEVADPVTDYTGKTVYTKKIYTWQCDNEVVEQIGCEKYETRVMEGDFDYKIGTIGYETKDFSAQFEQSLGLTNMMEQMQHIWSGWYGYCEKGYRYDDSWLTDPMTLLSFAMMMYSGALDGGYGDTMKKWANAASENFDKAAEAIGFPGAVSTDSSAAGFTDSLKEYNKITEIGGVDVLWTDVAQVAMGAFAEPVDDDYRTADEYMRSLMGESSADSAALAYRSCMASIGLSFPNIVGYSASVEEGASDPLKKPYENPIRLTRYQLAGLMHATSEKYVRTMYKVIAEEGDYYTIVAATADAYTQVGQVICSNPNVAKASNAISQKASEESSGINGGAMANAAIGAVLGKLPPPYNLVASVLFKALTSIQKGNACSDEEIALQWGAIQYKTNKFLNFGQCHHYDTDCVSKFLGKCIRKRREYCCYDQISTRIFVEGLKVQLGQDWSSCNGITINDLKNISFRECRDGEDPQADHCFPSGKYDELKAALMRQLNKHIDSGALAQQAANSMAIK